MAIDAYGYELALRYIFDCDRGGGPNGCADTDVWGDWPDVAQGLSAAIDRVMEDVRAAQWSEGDDGLQLCRSGLSARAAKKLRNRLKNNAVIKKALK